MRARWGDVKRMIREVEVHEPGSYAVERFTRTVTASELIDIGRFSVPTKYHQRVWLTARLSRDGKKVNVYDGDGDLVTSLQRHQRVTIEEGKLHEEYLHGVPEWQLRQDTAGFVDQIRERITQYIMLNKSQTTMDRQEAISAMNNVCDELEERVYDVLEDQLFAFSRRV